MNSLFFLLVKDIHNNSEYIYSDKPITKAELSQSFNECFLQLQSTQASLQLKQLETYAECFENISFLNKGWIWNSTELKPQVCYILRAVPILPKQSDKSESNLKALQSDPHPKKAHQYKETAVQQTLWKVQLTQELKNKLSQPNFGLKRVISV
jgi:hypothetical protein